MNGALRRVAGYQLERADRPSPAEVKAARLAERLAQSRTQLRQVRRELKESNRQLKATSAREAQRTQAERQFDPMDLEIMRRVIPRTMTDEVKLLGLLEAIRYLVRHGIGGDVVECGVWRGGSMQAVALLLTQLGAADRGLHLFDTFEGMPPPTEVDRRDGIAASDLLAARGKDDRMWAVAGLDDVRKAMSETEYPVHLVHFHQGMVEDTVPDEAPEQIALLRLDTDWYESTRHELEHLYDRLSPGGVLILDDYGDWEGARRATDEFFANRAEPVLLNPLGSGRVAVKPIGDPPAG